MKTPNVAQEPYASARLRLLARLQAGPAWTLDLRREPERWSANPAQRVAELRNAGHDVRTLRAWKYDKDGRPEQYRDYYVLFVCSKPVGCITWGTSREPARR